MTDSFPTDWTRAHLREVAAVQTGVAKGRRNFRAPVRRPYLRVANVQDGYLNLDVVKEIVVEDEDTGRYELQQGDVLLTEGGDNDKLGRGTVWRGEIEGCLHQNHVFAVRPNPARLRSEYLAALISSRHGRRYFDASAKQTTNLASINASQVRGFPIVFPEFEEQSRVVEALESFVRQTSILHGLLDAKRCFKRGLMQQLLTGTRRFKEFAAAPWLERRLGDVTEQSVIRNADGLPIKYVMAVRNDMGIVPMKDGVASSDLERYKTVRRGWFAYNPMRLNIGSIARWAGPEPVVVSPDYVVFRCDEERLSSEYLNHYVRTSMWNHYLSRVGSGGVRVRIWYDDLAHMPVRLPTADEQAAIVLLLNALDYEISLLVSLRGALDRQRRGVAELLLTGKVRVPA